jgi:predicted esterase
MSLACSAVAAMFLSLASVTGGALQSQPPAEPADKRAQGSTRPAPTITRADLAVAYIRLERAYLDRRPQGPERLHAHREMDRAAYEFFTAKHSEAIRRMNELVNSLIEPSDLARFTQSLKVRISPPIAHLHRPSIFSVRFWPLYEIPIPRPLDLRLVVRREDEQGTVVYEQAVRFAEDAPFPAISTRQPDASPGTYRVSLIGPAGEEIDIGSWFVVERSLDVQRVANERRLLEVDSRQFNIFQALVACRSRNAVLTDRPSENESAQFLINPVVHQQEVEEEVRTLLKGKDPYVGRTGDYWRAIPSGLMHIPSRVYAPEAGVKAGQPMPLVIVLHGAGADENAFMDATAAGQIKQLADQHGFLVVSPSTYWVMPNPQALEGIVNSMSANYSVDRSRVYVLGHSLGAMAAAGLAARHPDNLAGAVLIAGGRFARGGRVCPTLVLAAELDPIFPPHQLQGPAEQARADGLPVEFELMRDTGHVLIVGDVLPKAVEWLLAQRPVERQLPAGEP